MKLVKFSVVLFSVLVFSGCNAVKKLDKSNAHLRANLYDRPFVLPKDINSSFIENHYPIPQADSNNGPVNVSILPPGSKIRE
ncbi:MAG: hypothetical protein LBL17_03535 [Coxiellaceae bacterium]|jgi:uncharacterized lipoprotein|nr:hypothetical protein [Coxiellaceae bacterium]